MKPTRILYVVLLASLILMGKIWLEMRSLNSQTQNTTNRKANTTIIPVSTSKVTEKLIISPDDPIKGDKNASITIVEFGDFQCPYCGAFSGDNKVMVERMKSKTPDWEPLFPKLQKEYIDTGKIKFLYKDYAFLDDGTDVGESHRSAQAAYCANDQGKFWEYYKILYSNQSGENQGGFATEKLTGFAKTIGLNIQKFTLCLNSKKYAKKVSDNTNLAKSLGVNSTPVLFINGKLVINGAITYSIVKNQIEKFLKNK